MRLATSASASPTASMAVVLVLGARPSEQASLSGPRSIVTVAARPSVLVRLPVTATIGTPNSFSEGSSRTTSSVSPLCDSTSTQVFVMDAAQVAVHGFARMQVMAARAGRGQRGGDLLADQSGLAHAGDDHAAAAAMQVLDGAAELAVEPFGQSQQRLAFELDDFAGVAQLLRRPNGRARSHVFDATWIGRP